MPNGEPCWVAADVCRVLGIRNTADAIADLDDDEKGVATSYTLGGPQEIRTISESGLYTLILKSRKQEALAFKRWVTREMLPAIRKTGRYSMPGSALDSVPDAERFNAVLTHLFAAKEQRDAGRITSGELRTVTAWAGRVYEGLDHRRRIDRNRRYALNPTCAAEAPITTELAASFWSEALLLITRSTKIRALFSIRHVWLKQDGKRLPPNTFRDFSEKTEGTAESADAFLKQMLATKHCQLQVLREADLATYSDAPRVMFMAHNEVFYEYQRNSRGTIEEPKIGLSDLRDECKTKIWFLPPPKNCGHKQRLPNTVNCWAIALDTFPFADEFRDALEDTEE